MLWESMSENCDVCQCSSMNTSGFLNQRCCTYQNDDAYINKENIQQRLGSPMKQDADLSLYENSSPMPISCDGSPTHCSHQVRIRRPLEDHDNNSQDSGYGASCPSEVSKFFSPKTKTVSFSSHGSMDDEFLDICGLDEDEENARLPKDFTKLITGPLLANQEVKKSPDFTFTRPSYRRAISMVESTPPSTSRVRSCLFKQSPELRSFKRPEPPTDIQSPINTKRSRIFDEEDVEYIKPVRTLLHRSVSATEDSIKSALQRSSNEPDLIGDFSKSFCLPLTAGKHQDLKSITPTTLALLVKGHYNNTVASYKVIDCRYPYEYNGGHILGAVNIYTKQQILDDLISSKMNNSVEETDDHKREIIVFHCEFSSERGPNLSRFLRQRDRTQNKDFYPFLHYPELYLLDGGYKSFYEQYSELCVPEAYLPMLHPNHEEDLRHFRSRSKTFNADFRSKTNFRSSSFKRL